MRLGRRGQQRLLEPGNPWRGETVPGTLMRDTLADVQRRLGRSLAGVTVKELVMGVSYTAVRLSTDDIGLANTPLEEFSRESCSLFSRAGFLTDLPVSELAEMAQSWDLSQRVVGIATLNALSQLAIRTLGDDILREHGDVVGLTKLRKTDTVVMVGNMRPSVEKLRPLVKEVLVLERSIGLRDRETFPDTAVEVVIPRGDVVFLTGATLCNGTTDRILELSQNAREVIMLGPSAGLFPPSLFHRGVTAVAPMEILDADRAMKVIAEGGGNPALRGSAREVVYRRKG